MILLQGAHTWSTQPFLQKINNRTEEKSIGILNTYYYNIYLKKNECMVHEF